MIKEYNPEKARTEKLITWSGPVRSLTKRYWFPADPTAREGQIAYYIRDWYELNRETWWDRLWPFSNKSDEWMFRFIAKVHEIEDAAKDDEVAYKTADEAISDDLPATETYSKPLLKYKEAFANNTFITSSEGITVTSVKKPAKKRTKKKSAVLNKRGWKTSKAMLKRYKEDEE
jgi:hypothetical protein